MSEFLKTGIIKNFVAGHWLGDDKAGHFPVEDPATEETIAQCSIAGEATLETALTAARACVEQRSLSDMLPRNRAAMLRDIATEIRALKTEGAEILCRESGKSLDAATSEFEEAAQYFDYYSGLADKLEGKSIPLGPDYLDYTTYEPYGVSAQIVPWNFPVSLAARSLAPALAAGNSVIVKAPEQDPLALTMLGIALQRADIPAGSVSLLNGIGPVLGAKLVASSDIDQIVFTGSVPTGQTILKSAAHTVVPCLMELGGKSAAIAFEDTNIEQLMKSIKTGIFFNAGQVCSAMSRLIVHRTLYKDVVELAGQIAHNLTVGHGLENPDLTPLISATQLQSVEAITKSGIQDGATLITGGAPLNRPGHFMAPTILADVDTGSTIAQTEIFGPVLSISPFDSEEEAIMLANGTDFGLVAGVFTNDISRAHRVATRLRAGQVFINEWFAGGIETPFGGIGKSGFGREKGVEALYNYVRTKNVAIRIT